MEFRSLHTRRVCVLKIHVPVSATTLARLTAGDANAMAEAPALSAILAIIRETDPLGDFGAYRSVVELSLGWEMFTPAPAARPTLGAAGIESHSPTVILHVHLPAEGMAEIQTAIARIVDAHPWEVPVIEIASADLILPSPKPGEPQTGQPRG